MVPSCWLGLNHDTWAVLGSALLLACAGTGEEGSLPAEGRGRSAAACSPPAAFQGFPRTRGSASHPGIGLIPGTKSWPWSSSVCAVRRLEVEQGVLDPVRPTKQPQPIMRPVTLLTTNQAVAKRPMHHAMPTPLPSPPCLRPSIVKAPV